MNQHTPAPVNTEATPAVIKPAVNHNRRKNGIELSFGYKLDDQHEKQLTDKGWKWSSFYKHYYIRYSPEAFNFASNFSLLPGETDAAGGMIDANEEAGFDNFCLYNNI